MEDESQPSGSSRDQEAQDPRPYRSHRIPACDFCHRRKSRCHRERLNEPCSLCRAHGKQCTSRVTYHVRQRHLDNRKADNGAKISSPLRRAQQAEHPQLSPFVGNEVSTAVPDANAVSTLHAEGSGSRNECGESPLEARDHGLSSHIVGPTVAPDVWMLEQYMSPTNNGAVSHVRPNPYSVYSIDSRNPVVYLKVPKQRTLVATGNGSSGFEQFEIIENIVSPLGPHLLELYFDAVHPAFPLLDETAVRKAYQSKSLPYTIICEIYAVTLLSWDLSPKIAASGRNPPDLRYIWNIAVSAMHKDFQAPSMSTVLACILDILGRPITSITYNAINIGSCVALAQSLGLNRDPGKWRLNPRQKNLRVKTWWTLLIHDVWASLCHGTPGHIHRGQWDVQLPELCMVLDDTGGHAPASETRLKGAHSFISLCRLTQLLEEILAMVYSLQPGSLEGTLKSLRRLDANADELQDSWPPWLNPENEAFERTQPGALNLQLSFLAVKMCIARAALQTTRLADDAEVQYYQIRCMKVGDAFVDSVMSISVEETKVFWLPYIAYHFASAATLMMRCALEAHDDNVSIKCVRSARRFIDHLREMKSCANWDLADICLNQCETTVKQMSDSGHLKSWRQKRSNMEPQASANISERDHHTGLCLDGLPATGNADEVLESENFFGQLQEQMMGDFYFPDLWHA